MFNNLPSLFRRSGAPVSHDDKPVGEQNVIDKQRRAVFIYTGLTMFVADIVLWFLGIEISGYHVREMLHPVHLLLTIALFVLYRLKKLSVTTGISILVMANQLVILFDVAMRSQMYFEIHLILGYMVVAGLNMSLVLMAYIRSLLFVLGGLTLAGYGVCCFMSGESVLIDMFSVFLIYFLALTLLGHQLSRNVHRLEHEKSVLKDDEQKILNLLELDKSELMACISLAREKGLSTEQTGTLLDLIGKKARENIRVNVSYHYRQREIDYAGLRSCLPMLTPSEVEICDLILKEKKMNEILRILGKSRGNVTSQRTNIRRKLGLSPSDNLREALVKRTKVG